MELIKYVLGLSFASLSMGAIVIFLGKLIINKSSEILVENHRATLELTKIEYQLKLSNLYPERGLIVKLIFQDLFELEKKLETLTTLAQGPEWTTDTEKDTEACEQLNHAREILEVNRIYFSEKLCIDIENVLNACKDVILDMRRAKLKEKRLQDNISNGSLPVVGLDSIELWYLAEQKVKKDIRELRMVLANDFRIIIGAT